MLVAEALEVRTQNTPVLSALSFRVAQADVLTIMGPSGSGKSAVLSHIAGVVPDGLTVTGEVLLDGHRLDTRPAEVRQVGLLYQQPLLFPHMTVLQNVLFAVPKTAGSSAVRRALARDHLTAVELEDYAAQHPDHLSGGQKARVALARCLAAHPKALLLDEPFSALDVALRQRMRDLVFGQAKAAALPVVMVTHDPADAEAAAGQVIEIGT